MQHVVLLLEEVLQFLHEKFALQLILLVMQIIQFPECELPCQSLLQAAVHAVHVDGQLDYLADFSSDVIQCLLDKLIHLQEVAGYQYRHGILHLNHGLLPVNVSHQPVENVYVAVHADVYVICTLRI